MEEYKKNIRAFIHSTVRSMDYGWKRIRDMSILNNMEEYKENTINNLQDIQILDWAEDIDLANEYVDTDAVINYIKIHHDIRVAFSRFCLYYGGKRLEYVEELSEMENTFAKELMQYKIIDKLKEKVDGTYPYKRDYEHECKHFIHLLESAIRENKLNELLLN